MQLEIEEDVESEARDFADGVGSTRGVHFQADLHPADGALELAERRHDIARRLGIQDEDQVTSHRGTEWIASSLGSSQGRQIMSDTDKLTGKLAVVTGASRGIGAATAEALGAAGAHVILVARTATALEQVEDRIHAAGGRATIAPLDLTDAGSIGKLASAVAERWQKLDILIMNAAMLGSLTPVQDIDSKEYSRVLSLNVLANQALIAAFDPLLKRADKADVVGMTSSVGEQPRAFWGAYGSSKAALDNLLEAYADEVAYLGRVRVHIVDPGATRTRMRALAFPGEEPDSVKAPEIVATAILERLLQAEAPTSPRTRVEA
jgi:NAD(P)-dependent dehydrogenase (short-subunit alcohol dehydrogenase family)